MARLLSRSSARRGMRGRRPQSLRHAWLAFEPLETRRLLAFLGLGVQALADVSGAPGEATTEPIHVGESFWAQVRAWDERTGVQPGDATAGVISLPLDMTWPDPDQTVLDFSGNAPPEYPDSIPIPASRGDEVLTADFTQQRFVNFFEPSHVGVDPGADAALMEVQDLRGGSLPAASSGSAIGANGQPTASSPVDYAEFSLLRFDAVGAARAIPFDVALKGSMAFADAAALENDTNPTGEATFRVQMEASGVKYIDVNGNGAYDSGVDTPLSGWEIRAYADTGDGSGGDPDGLLNQDEYDAGPVTSAVTGADGSYGLWLDTGDPDPADPNSMGTAADYIFVEVLQSGWEQTSPNTVVLAAGLDTGAETLGDFGHTLTVDVGEVNQDGFNFDNAIVSPTNPSSLSGFVYVDADNSGQREEDSYGSPIELGLPNVTITLYRTDQGAVDPNAPIDQVTTGPGGDYLFSNLDPGTYRIVETQPECYLDGQETLGVILPGGNPSGVAGDDEFTGIELAAGEDGVDYLFGELGLRAACINKRMFLASTPSPKEVAAEHLDVPTETVLGTEGDDTIAFEADLAAAVPAMVVTVNAGTPSTFAIEQTRMLVIDARGGNDTVTLTVTEPDEQVTMRPGYATLKHEVTDGALRDWDYGVEVVNAEEVEEVDLAPEANLTVLRDTPRADALTAAGSTATLTTDDMARIARAITFGNGTDRVMATSASGGDDTKDQTLPLDFLLQLIGNWQSP